MIPHERQAVSPYDTTSSTSVTLRGATKAVTLVAELGGFGTDPMRGMPVFGVHASVTISRTDIGLAPNVPAAVVGDPVKITLDIQASLDDGS